MDEPVVFRRTQPVGRMTTTEVLPKPGLELCIGSNIFRSTNGVVKIHGREQCVIEMKPEHGLLFITFDLYNERGTRIAHLRRNVFMVNEGGRFAVDAQLSQSPSSADGVPSIRLIDLESGDIVLDARMASERKVTIAYGTFFSHKGTRVEITSHYCRIGSGTTRFGDIVEARGGPVILE
jgi:hypothetical protein